MTAFAGIFRALHVLLLALWFGAGAFFIFVVAPDTVAVLGSQQDAGTVINEVLRHFDLYALFVGPGILVTLVLGFMPLGVKLRLRASAAALMAVLVVAHGRLLAPEIKSLHDAMAKPIEDMPVTNALRMQLEQWQTVSDVVMVVHVALALILLVAAVVSMTPKRTFGIQF